jgi:hypothetical protein
MSDFGRCLFLDGSRARRELGTGRLLRSLLAAVCVLTGFGGVATAGQQAIPSTARDATGCVVVSARDATPAETNAVKDLADYLAKVTGKAVPVVTEKDATTSPRRIFVGWTDFATRHDCDGRKLGEEEWLIRSVDRDLIITGGRPRGTLYGVYEFLERELGCHWLDENTEVVPSIPNPQLGELNRRGQPAFWMREIYTVFATTEAELPADKPRFRVRNKANGFNYGSGGECHTFAAYTKGFPADHPEYLSMNSKGERIGAVGGSGPGGICLMHPEVRKLVLARLREFIAADRNQAAKDNRPAPRIYDISQNDNHWMCQCPECKAMSQREGSESGPVIDFINAIADGIRSEHPDIFVQTFAYSITDKPPKTLRPRDNVIIRVAELNAEFDRESNLYRPITDATNRAQLERLQGWSRIAKQITEWDYWVQYGDPFPVPYAPIGCVASDLATFLEHGVRNVFVECEFAETTSFFALKRWLGYQLMQNPRQPAEPLIETFMTGYYGRAGHKMREYLRHLENSVATVDANMSAMKPHARPYLTLAFYLTCERLLDEAEGLAAADSKALQHVRRERIPVDAGLYSMWSGLTRALPAGEKLPFEREKLLKRHEQYRVEQLVAFRTAAGIEKGRKELAEKIAKMREFTLPEAKKP